MKLGLMQPYFFPYLGYIDLIYQTDLWIIFDKVQYIKGGWINRNRILHPGDEWWYITVPVKQHSYNIPICDVVIARNNRQWQTRILRQLEHYKKYAPYFQETTALVKKGIYSEDTSIARLNVNCLGIMCEYLEIDFHYQYFSEMQLNLGPIEGPGDWALRISEALGATEYVNPPGGVDLFDLDKFHSSGIKLTIRHLPPLEYQCSHYKFIPNLSIIDVLMWNAPEKVREHLEKHC